MAAQDGKVASLFVNVVGTIPPEGRVTALFVETYGVVPTDGRVYAMFVEVFGIPSSGRVGVQGDYTLQGATRALQGRGLKPQRGTNFP